MMRLKSLYEMRPPQPQFTNTLTHLSPPTNGKLHPHDFFEDVSGSVSEVDDALDEMEIEIGKLSLVLNIRAIWNATRKKERLQMLRDIPVFEKYQSVGRRASSASTDDLDEK